MSIDEMIKQGKEIGMTEAEVRTMWEKTMNTPSALSEVTRWVTCPHCRYRASVTISQVDGNTGSWGCNECGEESVRAFSFTKAEAAFFEQVEESAI